MDFGTAELEKRELALAAVAAVGFLTAGSGNRLGAHLLGPAGVRRFPARDRARPPARPAADLLTVPRGAPVAHAGADLADAVDGDSIAPSAAGAWSWWSPTSSTASTKTASVPPRPSGSSRCAGSPPGTRCSPSQMTDPREHELPDVGLLDAGRPRDRPAARGVHGQPPAARAVRGRGRGPSSARSPPALRRSGATHLPLRTDGDWVADIVRHVHAHAG